MIVVDASAVLTVLTKGQAFEAIAEKICNAPSLVISPVSAMEALMVLSERYGEPSPILGAFLRQSRIAQRPVDANQAYWARQGFLTYGAGFSLGECFAYGAAKALDAPLLYTNGKFVKTDVRAA